MPLILTITSNQKDGLGGTARREFGIDGGTIGRSVESDWVLPDPQRYVSSRHCTIDFRGGCYYVIDTSTNGVYVNDMLVKKQQLQNFDMVRIAWTDFKLVSDKVDKLAKTSVIAR